MVHNYGQTANRMTTFEAGIKYMKLIEKDKLLTECEQLRRVMRSLTSFSSPMSSSNCSGSTVFLLDRFAGPATTNQNPSSHVWVFDCFKTIPIEFVTHILFKITLK